LNGPTKGTPFGLFDALLAFFGTGAGTPAYRLFPEYSMRLFFPRALRPAFVLVAVALGACSDVKPTETLQSPTAAVQGANAAKRASSTVSISALDLSSSSFTVNGASVTLTATIDNSGPSLSNVSVACTITQKKVSHAACAALPSFGGAPGVLPTGTSTVTVSIVASNDSAGQGAFLSGDATLDFTLVSASSTLAAQSAQIALVPISFFSNVQFTDFNPGDPQFSGSNMFAAVQSFGYSVAPFSSLDDATFAQAAQSNVMIIPELPHDLFVELSAAQRQSVIDLVARGGTLITVVQNTGFLNQLFGLGLRIQGNFAPQISASTQGTSFEGGPATLTLNSFNLGLVNASLPFRNLSMYLAFTTNPPTNTNFDSPVTVLRPANLLKGQIIVLGWNWFDGQPVGRQDGGWNDVLNRSIRFATGF
jgi:hypothetical protein